MLTRIRIVACVLALTSCGSLTAAGDEIDEYVERQIRALHIPGLSLAIVRDGRPVRARGYGLADLELRVPAAADTVYEIGSNTKQFTAAAIMLLVQDRLVRVEDPITTYFPDAPASWKRITVRHLLTHTSGIRNHVAVPEFMSVFKTDLLMNATPGVDELLAMFYEMPLEFEPGETWAYDNTGYILLGLLVEKVSGRSYWAFLDERILRPLGMRATRSTDPRALVPNRASGYQWVNGRYENRPVLGPSVAFSAGALLSTVEDLARWDAALHAGKLLSRASVDAMWTAARARDGAQAPVDYGFGWFVGDRHGRRLVQHSGGTPGFSSTIYRFLDDRLTVIVATNHADRLVDQLAIDIAGMYLPALKRPVGAVDPDPGLSRQLRDVVSDLLRGRRDSPLFTPPMRVFLNTATGKGLWEWFASHGELQAMSFSELEARGDGRLVRYRVVLGGQPYWFTIGLTGDGSIAQIYWW